MLIWFMLAYVMLQVLNSWQSRAQFQRAPSQTHRVSQRCRRSGTEQGGLLTQSSVTEGSLSMEEVNGEHSEDWLTLGALMCLNVMSLKKHYCGSAG